MSTERPLHPLASDHPGEVVRELRARLERQREAGEPSAALRLDLGRALFAQARNAEAARELETLLADPALAPEQRAAAQAVLAGALVLSGRGDEGRRAGEAALAFPAADIETRVLALSAIRGQCFLGGHYEEALEQARLIVDTAASAGPIARAEARLDMGGMLFHADQFDEAEGWLKMDPDASGNHLQYAAETRAHMDLLRGRWHDVLEHIPLLKLGGDPDRPDLTRVLRPAFRAHALVHLDRVEQARRELAASMMNVAPPISLVAAGVLAEADGDLAAVGAAAERGVAVAVEPRTVPQLRIWGPELVRLALLAGDRATATRAAHGLEAAAGASSLASVRGAATVARGMIERDPDLLATAVTAFADSPRVVAHGQAAEALAAGLSDRGQPAEAVAALRDALGVWESVGAVRDARRVAQALAGLGIRTRPLRRSADDLGWDALSPTETTVAALVGEGLSNAQIAARLVVSRRTVETHVAHVLVKLDVPSRAGVARVAAERADRPHRPG